jgi:chorismate mutase/prephenate dehydrogenase
MRAMTAPPAERDLAAMRAEIDAIDHALLDLIARRRALVSELFAYKHAHELPLIDPRREEDLLAERRAYAAHLGVPLELTETIFRAILDGSHAHAEPAAARPSL